MAGKKMGRFNREWTRSHTNQKSSLIFNRKELRERKDWNRPKLWNTNPR
jgi:hypothetical protein